MNPAAIPVPVDDVQGDGRWPSLHCRFLSETKEREPEVLFIGDSIIQQLGLTEIWEKIFVPLHCLNFGIGGDQTQHVLWRLQNGELDNISPKVVVVHVGTNNYGHSAEQVTGGLLEIVRTINERQPQAQVIVISLLPRGQYDNPLRQKLSAVNASLSERLASLSSAQLLQVDPAVFVSAADGAIDHADMYDYLHLTRAGYQKFAEPILDEVETLLKNFMTADTASIGEPEN